MVIPTSRDGAQQLLTWACSQGHLTLAGVEGTYLEHERLAGAESAPERFFMNVVLVRVLYVHALVAAPRLAVGRLAPVGRVAGDPRLGGAGVFLSLRRVLPDRYPLAQDVERYLANEQRLGRMLDYAVIVPRFATGVRVVRPRAGRATPARADSRRQSDLRVAVRRAARVAPQRSPLAGRVLQRLTRAR